MNLWNSLYFLYLIIVFHLVDVGAYSLNLVQEGFFPFPAVQHNINITISRYQSISLRLLWTLCVRTQGTVI